MQKEQRLRMAQETLGKVLGIKSFIKSSRACNLLSFEEFSVLYVKISEIEQSARYIAVAAENEFARLGNDFSKGLPKKEFYTT